MRNFWVGNTSGAQQINESTQTNAKLFAQSVSVLGRLSLDIGLRARVGYSQFATSRIKPMAAIAEIAAMSRVNCASIADLSASAQGFHNTVTVDFSAAARAQNSQTSSTIARARGVGQSVKDFSSSSLAHGPYWIDANATAHQPSYLGGISRAINDSLNDIRAFSKTVQSTHTVTSPANLFLALIGSPNGVKFIYNHFNLDLRGTVRALLSSSAILSSFSYTSWTMSSDIPASIIAHSPATLTSSVIAHSPTGLSASSIPHPPSNITATIKSWGFGQTDFPANAIGRGFSSSQLLTWAQGVRISDIFASAISLHPSFIHATATVVRMGISNISATVHSIITSDISCFAGAHLPSNIGAIYHLTNRRDIRAISIPYGTGISLLKAYSRGLDNKFSSLYSCAKAHVLESFSMVAWSRSSFVTQTGSNCKIGVGTQQGFSFIRQINSGPDLYGYAFAVGPYLTAWSRALYRGKTGQRSLFVSTKQGLKWLNTVVISGFDLTAKISAHQAAILSAEIHSWDTSLVGAQTTAVYADNSYARKARDIQAYVSSRGTYKPLIAFSRVGYTEHTGSYITINTPDNSTITSFIGTAQGANVIKSNWINVPKLLQDLQAQSHALHVTFLSASSWARCIANLSAKAFGLDVSHRSDISAFVRGYAFSVLRAGTVATGLVSVLSALAVPKGLVSILRAQASPSVVVMAESVKINTMVARDLRAFVRTNCCLGGTAWATINAQTKAVQKSDLMASAQNASKLYDLYAQTTLNRLHIFNLGAQVAAINITRHTFASISNLYAFVSNNHSYAILGAQVTTGRLYSSLAASASVLTASLLKLPSFSGLEWYDFNSGQRKTITLNFLSQSYNYIYSSAQTALSNNGGRWVLEVGAQDVNATSSLDVANISKTYIFNLKQYKNLDEAVRTAIQKIAGFFSSDLNAYVRVRGSSALLGARTTVFPGDRISSLQAFALSLSVSQLSSWATATGAWRNIGAYIKVSGSAKKSLNATALPCYTGSLSASAIVA